MVSTDVIQKNATVHTAQLKAFHTRHIWSHLSMSSSSHGRSYSIHPTPSVPRSTGVVPTSCDTPPAPSPDCAPSAPPGASPAPSSGGAAARCSDATASATAAAPPPAAPPEAPSTAAVKSSTVLQESTRRGRAGSSVAARVAEGPAAAAADSAFAAACAAGGPSSEQDVRRAERARLARGGRRGAAVPRLLDQPIACRIGAECHCIHRVAAQRFGGRGGGGAARAGEAQTRSRCAATHRGGVVGIRIRPPPEPPSIALRGGGVGGGDGCCGCVGGRASLRPHHQRRGAVREPLGGAAVAGVRCAAEGISAGGHAKAGGDEEEEATSGKGAMPASSDVSGAGAKSGCIWVNTNVRHS